MSTIQQQQHKGWFPSLESVKHQPEAIFSLFTSGNGKPLLFCSNVEYEVYCDGVLVGLGGHRCTQGEAYIDTWKECITAKAIRIRLHWVNTDCPPTQLPLYRSFFPNPFCVSLDEGEPRAWKCSHEVGVEFGARICSQLARQNVVLNDALADVKQVEADIKGWNLIPLPVEHMVMTEFRFPEIVAQSVIHPHGGHDNSEGHGRGGGRGGRDGRGGGGGRGRGRGQKGDEDKDVTNLLTQSTEMLYCVTIDLKSIGHSKILIEDSPVDDLVIVYSEVKPFKSVWATSNRKKVRMADVVKAKSGAPFGYRGCRYMHLISANSKVQKVKYRAIRAVYPLDWKVPQAELEADVLLSACKANLLACIDGGVVDTCWRERVQWVGDLRMSAKALRSMTNDTKVVPFALHQLADSYDPSVGMVQGAWPCRNSKYELRMPLYHLAFCLTALEYDATLAFNPRVKQVVEDSLAFWKKTYLKDGFIINVPGWMFTDWDFTNDEISARDQRAGAARPHAVLNAWWIETCTLAKIESGINLKAYEGAFKANKGYSLYQGGKPNIHATACAMSSGIAKSDDCNEFLLSEKWNGNVLQQVTAYFAFFVVDAFYKIKNEKACVTFINDFYQPIAKQHGSFYEKTNDSASMAHSWSIGFIELYLRLKQAK